MIQKLCKKTRRNFKRVRLRGGRQVEHDLDTALGTFSDLLERSRVKTQEGMHGDHSRAAACQICLLQLAWFATYLYRDNF